MLPPTYWPAHAENDIQITRACSFRSDAEIFCDYLLPATQADY
jgi:hypothetical protein